MTGLYLGDVVFENFEIPGRIGFGGQQRLAVHKFIGGARVIDILGRDDAVINWAGILSGQDAAGRARSLDLLRVEGLEQTLSWDAFCYSVVISKLELQFCNPWWIPYKISCVVQSDLAQGSAGPAISAVQAVAGDLATAAGLLGPGFTQLIDSASALAATSVAGESPALVALGSVQTQISSLLLSGQDGLQSSDLATIVSAAGSIANLASGAGYIGRSMANLSSLGY